MQVIDTPLEGVKLIEPRVFEDERGFFMETWNAARYREHGLPERFVQDNHSWSVGNVLRGLHYQYPSWQGKLVRVARGEIFDVAVDIRPGSATRGQWHGVRLSARNRLQLWIPAGFAHGFCVTSDGADVIYKCDAPYEPADDRCLLWNDPDIGIEWPVREPLISAKDRQGQRLRDLELE